MQEAQHRTAVAVEYRGRAGDSVVGLEDHHKPGEYEKMGR